MFLLVAIVWATAHASIAPREDDSATDALLLALSRESPADTTPDGLQLSESQQALIHRAHEGDAAAQNSVGLAFSKGATFGAPDARSAAVWFSRAALQNHSIALANLGRRFAEGRGVPLDEDVALVLLDRAAARDHAGAAVNAGLLRGAAAVGNSTARRQDREACDLPRGVRALHDLRRGAALTTAKQADAALRAAAESSLETTAAALVEVVSESASDRYSSAEITALFFAASSAPLADAQRALWDAALAAKGAFDAAFAELGGRVPDAARGELLESAVRFEELLLLAPDGGGDSRLSEAQQFLVLSMLQDVYAPLARDDARAERAMAWAARFAQNPLCWRRFAVTESDAACWNTAIGTAITYARRAEPASGAPAAGVADARDEAPPSGRAPSPYADALVALANSHPSAATRYPSSLQTPRVFHLGVVSEPWWDAARFALARRLEAEYARDGGARMRRELGAARAQLARVYAPYTPLRTDDATDAEEGGTWSEFGPLFFGAARRFDEEKCALVPTLCDALRAELGELCSVGVPAEACGTDTIASVLRLRPGGHILAHAGTTNRRLIMQFAIAGARGVRFRAGDRWVDDYGLPSEPRAPDGGRTIVFDDSFEHEVVHAGSQERYALLVVLKHPNAPYGQSLT